MHSFHFHIGDYFQPTARFSPEQHGVYLLLLLEYYKNEKPLEDDLEELEFLCAATTPKLKAALRFILKRCFTHDEGRKVYVQKRCERVISDYHKTCVQNRYAILCRHWEKVNRGEVKPTFEQFTANIALYYDEATGRIRKVTTRKGLVLEVCCEDDTSLPAPNYPPETINQNHKPETNSTPKVPKGTGAGKASGKCGESGIEEAIYALYPKKVGKGAALKAIGKALQRSRLTELEMQGHVRNFAAAVGRWPKGEERYVPNPATWFNQDRFLDDPATWERTEDVGHGPGFRAEKKEGGAGARESKKPAPEPEWNWRGMASEMGLTITCRWLELPASTRFEIRQAWDKKNKEGGAGA